MNKPLARFAALFALVLLSACGGGGGGGGSAVPPPGPVPTPTPTPSTARTAAVTIVLQVSGLALAPAAVSRRPRFVSPATANVSISINGGTPQTFAGGGQPCGSSTPTTVSVCTFFTVNAPLGTDTFTVILSDSANVVLSQGTTQATIVQDATNTVAIVFNGVAAGLTIHLADAMPPTGAVAHIPLSVIPVDAHGYSMVGAPGTLPDITVTDSDQSGVTGLYLAPDSGACPDATGGLTRTITTTQSGTFYRTVCVVYTGGSLPSGATFTATIAGLPSSSTILAPNPHDATTPSGVWAFGNAPSGPTSLVRFDTAFSALQTISGASTTFGGSAPTPVALAVEPVSGNVEVVQSSPGGTPSTYIDATYSGNATGNVAPASVTSFALPQGWTARGAAVSGDGSLYVAAIGTPGTTSTPQACQIYRVALNGAASTPVAVYDCTNTAVAPGPVSGFGTALTSYPVVLRFDAQSRLYLGDSHPSGLNVSNQPLYEGSIFRFLAKPDGSLQPDSSIRLQYVNLYDFDFKSTGDVLANVVSGNSIVVYAGTSFQDMRSNSSPAIVDQFDSSHGSMAAPVAADPSDNLWVTDYSTNPVSLALYPTNLHTPAVDANFRPLLLAHVTTAVASGGAPIHATPSAVEVPGGSNIITVTESGYTGQFTESDNCAGKATITPHTAAGPSATFTVNPSNSTGGTCTAQFSDASNHVIQVQIGVTATVITGSSKKRRT